MAFTVEDGTGVAGANSLVDVAFADEYFADRGNTVWAALTTEQKQSALILASDYASTQYQYKGEKASVEQALAFPRTGVVDPQGQPLSGIPSCIKRVVAELAVRASSGTLLPDPEFDENGRLIKSKMDAIGPLKTTVEYAGPGDLYEESRYPAVDAMMCPWLIKAKLNFAHGVKLANAGVSGVRRNEMQAVHQDMDRYTGPLNENHKDVGVLDGDSAF